MKFQITCLILVILFAIAIFSIDCVTQVDPPGTFLAIEEVEWEKEFMEAILMIQKIDKNLEILIELQKRSRKEWEILNETRMSGEQRKDIDHEIRPRQPEWDIGR